MENNNKEIEFLKEQIKKKDEQIDFLQELTKNIWRTENESNKEKIMLKLEILNDIRSCMSFNFGAMDDTLSLSKINNTIKKYESILEGIELNEN